MLKDQIPLLEILPRRRQQEISRVCKLLHLRKGQALFQEGDPATHVWLIQRGWVHLVKRSPQGTPVTVFTVTPEEILCGYSAVVGRGTYYASAIAATETTAWQAPQEVFQRFVQEEPGFGARVLAIYHARMRKMAEAISMAQAPVEQRLAYTLLRLQHSFGRTIPVTHHELARMAGIRWETSIRTLSRMKRRGWIASARGRVMVLEPARLQSALDGAREA